MKKGAVLKERRLFCCFYQKNLLNYDVELAFKSEQVYNIYNYKCKRGYFTLF